MRILCTLPLWQSHLCCRNQSCPDIMGLNTMTVYCELLGCDEWHLVFFACVLELTPNESNYSENEKDLFDVPIIDFGYVIYNYHINYHKNTTQRIRIPAAEGCVSEL